MEMRTLTIQEQSDLIKFYNSGRGTAELAKEYNLDKSALRWWLKKRPEVIWRGRREYFLNENALDVLNKDGAYFLGFFAADGSVGKYDLRFEIQLRDEQILKDFAHLFGYSGPIKYSHKQNKYKVGHYCRLGICNPKLRQRVMDFGIVPDKTHHMSIKFDLLEPYISHFIRGFFDGDGCLYTGQRKDGTWRHAITITLEKTFAPLFASIITSQGISCRIERTKSVIIDRLVIESHEEIEKFLNWIYKDAGLKLKRKHESYLNFLELREEHNKDSRKDLNKEQVASIRKLLKKNKWTTRQIAARFGCGHGTISCIHRNKTYKNY